MEIAFWSGKAHGRKTAVGKVHLGKLVVPDQKCSHLRKVSRGNAEDCDYLCGWWLTKLKKYLLVCVEHNFQQFLRELGKHKRM